MSRDFIKTYNSFSGIDMIASIGDCKVGLIQCIKYSVSRKMVPIYSKESSDPRSFERGKRAISGSLVFAEVCLNNIIETMCENELSGQFPAFDIAFIAANVFGSMCRMEIKGCELMNRGYGISFLSLKAEEPYTYIAKTIIPWVSWQQ